MTKVPVEVHLRFCGLDGRYRSMTFLGGPWEYGVGWQLPVRRLRTTADHTELLQKAVPVELGRLSPVAYDRLENEIRAGVRLDERYRLAYPSELLRLVGYNVDVVEPFLLFEPPDGPPVGEVAGTLLTEQQQAFVTNLLRGLTLLGEAGIVHGNLNPTAVRWDGRSVHLGDLTHARMLGEVRPGDGAAPWAAPERRAVDGEAAVSDDVWSAGMLIYHVITGRPVAQLTDGPNLDARGTSVRRLLDGVFAIAPQSRPSVTELLARSRGGAPAPIVEPLPDGAFTAGRAEFDKVRARKVQPAEQPVAPSKPRARRVSGRVLAIAGVVVVLAVAAATLLTQL